MAAVGVIGIGAMGMGVARALLARGFGEEDDAAVLKRYAAQWGVKLP